MGGLATADSKFGSLPTFIDAADDVQPMEIIVEDGTASSYCDLPPPVAAGIDSGDLDGDGSEDVAPTIQATPRPRDAMPRTHPSPRSRLDPKSGVEAVP